ncbi:MAG: 2OG-Fe(II) oxygenase [Burkholderiales bacterium]
MHSIANELAAALHGVRTPGDFYAAGASAMPLPRLTVNGVGPVALPLLAVQAEQLIAVADRAPYGRGEETLIDTQVRRTWQIRPDQVQIEGKNWAAALDAMVKQAAAGLGVTAAVMAELYKLLVYDEGSFFVSHRDTEKAPGMFATLIIALPSVHAGGELVVRHKDREVRLELRSDDPSESAFAAFYADCVHEVLPVTSGCRLALVYNLLRTGRGKLPQPPSYEAEQARLAALLRRWPDGQRAPEGSTPDKLVYPLEHAYTPAELSFAALKGADAARAAVLTAAAEQSDCDLHVALLTIEESGAAEYTGYSAGGGLGYRDYDDEPELEADEVLEHSRTLSAWARPDGAATPLGPLPLEDAEVSPADALDDMEPDEEYFEEATGNEGASFERTYRRAALVLWPHERRLAVLNQGGLSATLPYLSDLARRWKESGEGPESPQWREAHELSGHMVRDWPKPINPYFQRDEPSPAAEMLALLTRLNDTARIEAMAFVFATGGHGKSDNQALLQALSRLPAPRAGELVAQIVAANATNSLDACGDLLAHGANDERLCGHLCAAATALVDALPGDPKRKQPAEFAWRKPTFEVGFIVDLMTALSRTDAKLADRAVSHALAWPKTFGLDAVLLPALRRLFEQTELGTLTAFQRLRAACVEHLRERVAQPLAPPADWTRAAAPGCECPRCKELNRFLQSPAQRTWTFKANEFDRLHVLDSIKRGHCDVDSATDKHGRPYSLVCTKNQASYERRARQRKQDLADLERLT